MNFAHPGTDLAPTAPLNEATSHIIATLAHVP